MIDISPTWVALLGTVFGGVGLKVVESRLAKKTKQMDIQANFQLTLERQIETLKKDIINMRVEVDSTEKEMDEWREKYWKLMEEFNAKQVDLLTALSQLKQRVESEKPLDKPAGK